MIKYLYFSLFLIFNLVAGCFLFTEFWLVFEELREPFKSLGRLFLSGLISLIITIWVFYNFYWYIFQTLFAAGDMEQLKKAIKNKTQILIAWSFLLVTTVSISCIFNIALGNFSLSNIVGALLGIYGYFIYKMNVALVYQRLGRELSSGFYKH